MAGKSDVTPIEQQDYIINKMTEHHGNLEDRQAFLI